MSIQNLLLLLDAAGYDVVSTLLSMLWQSTILFAAAGALAFFLRRKKETIRHAVWLAALLALPLLPMLSRGVFPLIASRTEIAVIPDYAGPRETPFPQARLNQPSDTQQSDAPARSGKAISPPITAASGNLPSNGIVRRLSVGACALHLPARCRRIPGLDADHAPSNSLLGCPGSGGRLCSNHGSFPDG